MLSSFFDFITRKKKEEEMSKPTLAGRVVDQAGVRLAVKVLDNSSGLTREATATRTLSRAAHNVHEYHLCGGKYLEKGVRVLRPKERLIPMDVVYNGYIAGSSKVTLRKGENDWSMVQDIDMYKTANGQHIASILVKVPTNSTADTHHMHMAFYTKDGGQENWDNNKGQNFSFEIPMMGSQTTAQANNQGTTPKNNILNSLLGITPKKISSN